MPQHQPGQSTRRRRAFIAIIVAVIAIIVALFALGPCPPPSKPIPAGAPVNDDLPLQATGDGGEMPPPPVVVPKS